MRRRIATFVIIAQLILFLAHGFIYWTWLSFLGPSDPLAGGSAKIALAFLSISFVAASLIGFRYSNFLIRVFYTVAAVWMGLLNYLILAAFLSWVSYGLTAIFHLQIERRNIALLLFGLAVCTCVYALVNARWTRVRRISVKLPNLPNSWRGRVAALVGDTHLGHVRGRGFSRRIVGMLNRLKPDVVFITGDLYDGTAVDLDRVTQPWTNLAAPLGAYFVEGNHEEFSDSRKYLDAVRKCGIRVLSNEKTSVDGLDLIGVPYRTVVRPAELLSALRELVTDRNRASILLAHAPDHVEIAEEAGVSLQLSGHTHRGQFFPWTWVTARIYGQFVYGLSRSGNLWVYTTSGAGTWGPPVRLGAPPEIVLIHFDS